MKSKKVDSKKNSKASFIIISLLTLFVLGFTYAFCNIEIVKEAISGKRDFFKADIASGTCGDCNWRIKDDGEFILYPFSGSGNLRDINTVEEVPWYNHRTEIKSVKVYPDVATGKYAMGLFAGLVNCTRIDIQELDTVKNKTVNLSHFFEDCKRLTSLSLPDSFVTKDVTNISYMFNNCQSLITVDVSRFNTINVTSIQSMFMNCYRLETITWGNFYTNNVTNFGNLFNSANSLRSVKAFSTPKAINMMNMFYACSSLTSIDLTNFVTNNVTNMRGMFYYCRGVSSLDFSNFNMSAVTNVNNMLSGLRNCNSIILGSDFKCKINGTNVYLDEFYWRKSETSHILSSSELVDNFTSEDAGRWIRTCLINYHQGEDNIGQSYIDCGQTGNLTRYELLTGTTPANWGFFGWSTSSTGINRDYLDIDQIENAPVSNSPINLYAIYSRTLTIQYDGNGATGGSTPNTTKNVVYNPGNGTVTGSQMVSLAPSGYTKEGILFAGWTANSDGSGTIYAANSSYNPSLPSDDSTFTKILYAKWSSNAIEYTVNHYVHDIGANTYTNEMSYNLVSEKGSNVTLSSLSTIIPGATYVEGFVNSGDTTKPTSGAVTSVTIPNSGSMTINLYYRRNYLYVAYNCNGGTLASIHGTEYEIDMDGEYAVHNGVIYDWLMGVYGSKVYNINEEADTYLPNNQFGIANYNNEAGINFVKSGYKGKEGEEWYTINSLGVKTYYSQADNTDYDANTFAQNAGFNLETGDVYVTLYVNWIPCEYTVTYDANEGVVDTESISVTYNNEYGRLEYPTREGYGFLGWSIVPSDYEQLEYIESNGGQYVDSGYKPSTRTGVDVKFAYTDVSIEERIFGEQGLDGHPGTMNYEVYIGHNDKLAYGYKDGSGNWIQLPIDVDTDIHRLKFNVMCNSLDYDNTLYTISNQSTITSPYNMYIMTTNQEIYQPGQVGGSAKIRIYDFTIYEAGILQKSFIPCRRRSDGKLGLYELVEGVFCPCLGSEGALAGPNAYIDASTIVSYAGDHTLYANWGIKNYVVQYYLGNNDEENQGAVLLDTEMYRYGEHYNLKTISELGGQEIQGWEFAGWNDDLGYTNDGIKYSDGQSVINLRTGSQESFTNVELTEGKYINYYDKDGQKTLCRVLYDANSPYGRNGVQIVSVDNINNVTLSGENGCSLEFLNNYEIEKLRTDLVQSVRTVGSLPDDKNSCDELSETYEGQKNYLIDYNKMEQLGIVNVGHDYWVGSESYVEPYYKAYYVDTDGTVKQDTLFEYIEEEHGDDPIVDPIVDPGGGLGPGGSGYEGGDDGTDTGEDPIEEPTTSGNNYTASHGFRPVYTLRQDIRVISGEGTADNPYDLGVYYDDEIIRLYGIYERTIKFHSGINDEVITETQYYNPYSVFYTSDVEAPKPSLSGLEEYNWQGLGYRGDTNAEPEDYTISEGVIIENPDETFDTSLGDYTTDDDITSVTGTSGDTGSEIIEIGDEGEMTIIPAYNDYDEFDPTSTILNLYAIYSRDLTMSYNGNGATSGSMEVVQSDVPQYLNSSGNISGYIFTTGYNEFSKNGYDFRCWANDSADGEVINEGEDALEFSPAADNANTNKEIYALWDIITYEIIYDLNDGELTVPNPTSYDVETTTFTLNKPTKVGYTFIGWTGTNGDTPEKDITIEKGSTGDREYVANWAENVVVVNINKDNVAWSDSGMYVALFQDGVEKYSTVIDRGTQVTFNLVYEGTYDVYAGKSYLNKTDLVDTGIDVVVGDATN